MDTYPSNVRLFFYGSDAECYSYLVETTADAENYKDYSNAMEWAKNWIGYWIEQTAELHFECKLEVENADELIAQMANAVNKYFD